MNILNNFPLAYLLQDSTLATRQNYPDALPAMPTIVYFLLIVLAILTTSFIGYALAVHHNSRNRLARIDDFNDGPETGFSDDLGYWFDGAANYLSLKRKVILKPDLISRIQDAINDTNLVD